MPHDLNVYSQCAKWRFTAHCHRKPQSFETGFFDDKSYWSIGAVWTYQWALVRSHGSGPSISAPVWWKRWGVCGSSCDGQWNLGTFLHTGIKKIIHVVSGKRKTNSEKVLNGSVSKHDHAYFLLGLRRATLAQIPSDKKGKCKTITQDSYFDTMIWLLQAIKGKHHGKLLK